ncbi:hypothetical protein EAS64_04595 [Trebonia kvetii]|uniref:Uncharacterized protein n=1 Tax=Trebonia kvetii TaxID=2480626 RepID=A0A6P2CBY0_9ACTN|nr:hypothetical protein EAS64_04595 [Trebonia kvetii]
MKPGSRWRSAVCDTEVVVVRAPAGPVTFHIGGAEVIPADAGQDRPGRNRGGAQPDAALAGGTLLGKRYTDEATGLQVLCVKPGEGTITVDGRPATVVAPRQLPASD